VGILIEVMKLIWESPQLQATAPGNRLYKLSMRHTFSLEWSQMAHATSKFWIVGAMRQKDDNFKIISK